MSNLKNKHSENPAKLSGNKFMPSNLSRQSGMTMISTVVIVVFLLFQVVIAMNVLPVYMTDYSVKSIMEELPNDGKARAASTTELKTLIAESLRMNNVYDVKPSHITIKKGRGETVVNIDYEPRGKLVGNLEYIVNFHHEARIPGN